MRIAAAALFVLLFASCRADEPVPEGPSPDTAVESPPGGVIVHLFEWRWDDIATECESYLGPAGFAAVQVSPPSENSVVEGRPWWERYQPVSYVLDTRSGDRAAFADMVTRCGDAGVDIYVDAIINHTTGVYSGVGTAGSTFSEYDYPGLYDRDDFHHCGISPGDDIKDFNGSDAEVWTCELVNLADLATETDEVRERLASYLQDLVDLGVKGFRVDAARHMDPADLIDILGRVSDPGYVYQEVNQAGWVSRYYPAGAVTDFTYGYRLSEVFRDGDLSRLFGEHSIWKEGGYVSNENALVFVDNHDTQRGHGGPLTYKDGARYEMALAFMLAYPFGRPRLMSSYAFEDGAQGPPADELDRTLRVHREADADCGNGRWVCEHRRPWVRGMVGFRNHVSGPVTNAWSDGADRLAFGRGDSGFLVLNRHTEMLDARLQTGLPGGSYCNVAKPGCDPIVVDDDGWASFGVSAMGIAAIHFGAQALP